MLDWIEQNWSIVYIGGALIGFLLAALVSFVGIWWFAAARYDLWGLVLGWVPGAVAAMVAGVVIGIGWPLVVIALLLWGSTILSMIEELATAPRS